MKVSTRVRYGSRALVDLTADQRDGPVSLEAMASKQHIPERYLAKIIQDLRRNGVVRSQRGAHGGYVLTRPPEEITMLDVWVALEGPLRPVDCLEHPDGCQMVDECATRDVWEKFRDTLVAVLGSVTLADLAERAAAKRKKHKKASP